MTNRPLYFLASFLIAVAFAGCSWFGSDSADLNANTQDTADVGYTDASTALADGIKLLESGDTEGAIEVLNRAVEIDPDRADAYFHLGIAYSLIEFRDQMAAKESLDEGPAMDEGEKPQKDKRPNSEIAFEKAVEAYKKRTTENKDDHVAFYNLGRSYAKLDQDVNASNALRQAVKLKPDDSDYQTELGSILMRLAKYPEAVAALRKALELDPDNLMAEDLLEKAEAGQKRISFTVLPKDTPKPEPGDANANTGPTSANTDTKIDRPPPPPPPKPRPTGSPANRPMP